jgi:D-alanyl-D-alanine dipeptidase
MRIIIKDNHEPLVDVKKYCPGVVVALDKKRMAVEKTVYLRKSVAKMLKKAQGFLPKGVNFIIGDAWRPSYIQAEIYFSFIRRFEKKYPKWSRQRIIREVEKYVAPWKGSGASGHMTGGAIDLRLVDRRGHKIPMKSRRLSYQENAFPVQKKLPGYIQRNREILFKAMRKAGFSNCHNEYWHWSYGDYYWAKRNNKPFAIYGAVQDHRGLYKNKLCPCESGKKYAKCCGA